MGLGERRTEMFYLNFLFHSMVNYATCPDVFLPATLLVSKLCYQHILKEIYLKTQSMSVTLPKSLICK